MTVAPVAGKKRIMDIENFKKNLLEALRDKSFASKVRDLFLDECTEFDIDVFFTEDGLDAIAKRVLGKLKGVSGEDVNTRNK